MENRLYLGDSVYIEDNGYMFRLYLNNGMGDHTEIFMEDYVVQALLAFLQYRGFIESYKLKEKE